MDRNYKCAFFYFFEAIVALRKESVDRNRRKVLGFPCKQFRVALRKESVDRNISAVPSIKPIAGRSPQGERG